MEYEHFDCMIDLLNKLTDNTKHKEISWQCINTISDNYDYSLFSQTDNIVKYTAVFREIKYILSYDVKNDDVLLEFEYDGKIYSLDDFDDYSALKARVHELYDTVREKECQSIRQVFNQLFW